MKRTFGSQHEQHAPIYLDCNATTPLEPSVRDAMIHWLTEEIGNAGSRTHEYGVRAKRAVQHAREQIAVVIESSEDEIIFTSGATESNNLAILGLGQWAKDQACRHIVSTAIEHKAVLEPLKALEKQGFSVTLVKPQASGAIAVKDIVAALRTDTFLVSCMHVNNETGVLQPIGDIAYALADHEAFFHVDAAQGFGKELDTLRHPRIDLISVSSHKIYGPVGIGALAARRRRFRQLPLAPLIYGGGQEQGLRSGTLPVPLIVGFGLASELANRDSVHRRTRCLKFREQALRALRSQQIRMHSDLELTLPHVINFSVEGVDSEAIMIVLKDIVAVSNGSACTSQGYEPSHVLKAMNLPENAVAGAVRMSWCHLTPEVDWQGIAGRIGSLR